MTIDLESALLQLFTRAELVTVAQYADMWAADLPGNGATGREYVSEMLRVAVDRDRIDSLIWAAKKVNPNIAHYTVEFKRRGTFWDKWKMSTYPRGCDCVLLEVTESGNCTNRLTFRADIDAWVDSGGVEYAPMSRCVGVSVVALSPDGGHPTKVPWGMFA